MTSLHSQINEGDEYSLPFKETGYLRIPIRLAEKYLTEETENNQKAVVQPIGTHLQVLIESERKDMIMHIPFKEWECGDVYTRSLSGWTLNLKRWKENIHKSDRDVKVQVYWKDDI